MKILLPILACILSASCAPNHNQDQGRDPFSKSYVADIQPVTDPTDLKQLIKSLPVWDCPPPECPPEWTDGWIRRNGTVKGDTLSITGDGAQIALRITRLPTEGEFELEGGTKDWPEGGRFLYRLKRLANGWQVLSREEP